jgi:7-cyano-7-deazaguanine reductase
VFDGERSTNESFQSDIANSMTQLLYQEDWNLTYKGKLVTLEGDVDKRFNDIKIAIENMSTAQLDNSKVSKVLGRTVNYPDQYDRSILVREPRLGNRKHLDLDDNNLPFCGYDIWNAYEVSCLTKKGFPVTGIAKIVYPCDNKYIVESKSLKLYFNSFNMTQFGGTSNEARDTMVAYVEADLSNLLETDVHVNIFAPEQCPNIIQYFSNGYDTLENRNGSDELYFTDYNELPELLATEFVRDQPYVVDQKYHSSLLKSNCRVTHQPDWGDVYIAMKGKKVVRPKDLLKYIVSFRDENHFHEEICETIYKRLWDTFEPKELAVTCLYARRGGIDINPTRLSPIDLPPYQSTYL